MASKNQKKANQREPSSARRRGLNKKASAASAKPRSAIKKLNEKSGRRNAVQTKAEKELEEYMRASEKRYEEHTKRLDAIVESFKTGLRAIMGEDYKFTKI